MTILKDKIAVVTGASRGIGRGIALALGDAGATVYVTGRSIKGEATTENLPGTIEETAEMVTARGGTGIPVRCDHTNNAEIASLFERIDREQGKLDVLVNSAWGGYAYHEMQSFTVPFWEQPLRHWDGMFTAGVRATLETTRLAMPTLLTQTSGLIINITAWLEETYLKNLFYDTAKAAINRMTFGMAQELKAHNITVVALSPGFVRTERVAAAFEAIGNKAYVHFTESPEYTGRAVVALAADPEVTSKSGALLYVGDLAAVYHFTDIDGRYIPRFTIPKEE